MIDTFLASKTGNIIPTYEHDKFRRYMFNFLNGGRGKHKYIVRRTRIQKKDQVQTQIIKQQLRHFLNIRRTRRNRFRKHKTRKKTK